MKKLLPLSLLLTAALTSFAQPQEPLPLWPEGAPGALGKEAKDTPTLTAYLPEAEKASCRNGFPARSGPRGCLKTYPFSCPDRKSKAFQ